MTRLEFVRSRLLAPPLPPVPSLPVALAFAVIPTGLRWSVDTVVTGTVFAAYFPFVLLAALLFGSRVAIIAMLVSTVLANYLFMEPRYVLFASPGDTLGALSFLLSSSLIIAVVATLRRAVGEVHHGLQREAALNAKLNHLNAELQHRVKNMLSIVQGLATQTFRNATASDDALRLFKGRLHALAEAQDVLTSGDWQHCRLPDLAVRALAPFNGQGAIEITGPVCALPETSCVPLVLALHELGTNAMKYGSLSIPSGSVDLAWRLAPDPSGTLSVIMEWAEADGPVVGEPARRGLGSKLLRPQNGLQDVVLDFRPEGLLCRIGMSVPAWRTPTG